MADIDIKDLLEDYAKRLGRRDTQVKKVMQEAAKEIGKLRTALDFYTRMSEDNNKSRLHYMDQVINATRFFEHFCEEVRADRVDDIMCRMCSKFAECDGLHCGDCFKLNSDWWQNVLEGGKK